MTVASDPNSYRRRRRAEKISESIAREIARDIIAKGLRPGAKLPPESVMLDTYGVGRASLREALRILEVHGLLAMKPGPGGGPVVADVNSEDFGRTSTFYFHLQGATLWELTEARTLLEPVTAARAAAAAGGAHREELRTLIDKQAELTHLEGSDYTDLAGAFHSLVAGMSGNRVLDVIVQSLTHVFEKRFHDVVFPLEHRQDVLDDHSAIGEAILAGDAEGAHARMTAHMHDLGRFYSERFPGALHEVIEWQ